jgi:hypothetical protein
MLLHHYKQLFLDCGALRMAKETQRTDKTLKTTVEKGLLAY